MSAAGLDGAAAGVGAGLEVSTFAGAVVGAIFFNSFSAAFFISVSTAGLVAAGLGVAGFASLAAGTASVFAGSFAVFFAGAAAGAGGGAVGAGLTGATGLAYESFGGVGVSVFSIMAGVADLLPYWSVGFSIEGSVFSTIAGGVAFGVSDVTADGERGAVEEGAATLLPYVSAGFSIDGSVFSTIAGGVAFGKSGVMDDEEVGSVEMGATGLLPY